MQQRSLGNEGLKVSALGLGCMAMTPLYDKPDPNEAARTIDAAIDGGVTMIDTADAYNDGKNEELVGRSEEHTSELQSLMRISYAVFCLKKKNTQQLTSTHRYMNTI